MTLFSKVLAKITAFLLFILSFANLCFYAFMTLVAFQTLSASLLTTGGLIVMSLWLALGTLLVRSFWLGFLQPQA